MSIEDAPATPSLSWTLRGSTVDWDAVYGEELPRIYNYFRFRIGHGPDAEDLTARTFEKAWRRRDGFHANRGAFSTWLLAIARNVAIDHYRRHRPSLPLEAAETVAIDTTPEQQASGRSDMARLQFLTRGLPDRERELLALKYGAQLTNRAIAELTGLSESNVGTILHRTVQMLRAAW